MWRYNDDTSLTCLVTLWPTRVWHICNKMMILILSPALLSHDSVVSQDCLDKIVMCQYLIRCSPLICLSVYVMSSLETSCREKTLRPVILRQYSVWLEELWHQTNMWNVNLKSTINTIVSECIIITVKSWRSYLTPPKNVNETRRLTSNVSRVNL